MTKGSDIPVHRLQPNKAAAAFLRARSNHRGMKQRAGGRGYTLIELMIVVLVIALLAALAYPSYLEQARKTRRSEAKAFLIDAAAKLEQYWGNNKKFPDDGSGVGDMTKLGYAAASNVPTPEGWYNVSLAATPTTYTLTATPQKDQAKDKKCGNFTLNNLGVKDVSGTWAVTECW